MQKLSFKIVALFLQIVNLSLQANNPAQELVLAPSPATHFGQRLDPQTGVAVTPTILVLHYTAASLERTIAIFIGLRGPQVSAHYTVAEDGTIYQHVAEEDSAYHAGISYWDHKPMINRHSIGIEQVNDGYKERESQPEGIIIEGSDRQWYLFDPREIASTILLCQDIIARHHIEPRNVVGHGDVAPKRKVDPGPLFPWKQLAEYGVGAWPDFTKAWILPCLQEAEKDGLLEQWLIKHVHIWGYKVPDEGATAQEIIAAFQMHFRSNNISGIADLETAYILDALICNYLIKDKCPCEYEK